MRARLEQCDVSLQLDRSALHGAWMECIKSAEILRLLHKMYAAPCARTVRGGRLTSALRPNVRRSDDVCRAPGRLDALLEQKQYAAAAELVRDCQRALDADLANVGALDDIRGSLRDRHDGLVSTLLEDLTGVLFLREELKTPTVPLWDPSRLDRVAETTIDTVLDALLILLPVSDVVDEMHTRLPAQLATLVHYACEQASAGYAVADPVSDANPLLLLEAMHVLFLALHRVLLRVSYTLRRVGRADAQPMVAQPPERAAGAAEVRGHAGETSPLTEGILWRSVQAELEKWLRHYLPGHAPSTPGGATRASTLTEASAEASLAATMMPAKAGGAETVRRCARARHDARCAARVRASCPMALRLRATGRCCFASATARRRLAKTSTPARP